MDSVEYLASVSKTFENTIKQYADIVSDAHTKGEECRKAIIHAHASHGHPCCHSYGGDTDLKNYADKYFKTCPDGIDTKVYLDEAPLPEDLLMKEYSMEVDCDENGKVFAKHFILDKNDPAVPKILISMQRLVAKDITKPVMKWQQYLSTVPVELFE